MLNYIKSIAFFVVLLIGMVIGMGATMPDMAAPAQPFAYVLQQNIEETKSIEDAVNVYAYHKTISYNSAVYHSELGEIIVYGERPNNVYHEKIPNDSDGDSAATISYNHKNWDSNSKNLISYTTITDSTGVKTITMIDPSLVQLLGSK